MTAPAEPTTPAPPPLSHAQRLQASGWPITLADGREVRVRYGMGALVALEERFGSLTEVEKILKDMGSEARVFGPITDLLVAGIVHTGITREELLADELLDPDLLMDYANAVGRAFSEAFPALAAMAGRGNGHAAKKAAGSRGKTGTTSGRSSSGAAKKRSG